MAAARLRDDAREDRPSPVVAAVLALVIERPSYGWEFWKRFEDRFWSLYPVSSSRLYQALDTLRARGLVEEIPVDDEPQTRRQPKVHYRATSEGVRIHRAWMAATFRSDPHREELLRRLLATSANDATAMLEIVDAYERICLDEMAALETPKAGPRVVETETGARLRELLITEEQRLAHESRLKFVAYARRAVNAEIQRRSASDSRQ